VALSANSSTAPTHTQIKKVLQCTGQLPTTKNNLTQNTKAETLAVGTGLRGLSLPSVSSYSSSDTGSLDKWSFKVIVLSLALSEKPGPPWLLSHQALESHLLTGPGQVVWREGA
jgi:hypothetical protein